MDPYDSTVLLARADSSSNGRPPIYKAIGISLAVASGVFIGISFVLKKTGLLKANVKYNEEAGEGYGYLKNVWWWSGMTLMIIGEICNFVAYAFVDAILVTPLGALSVVITTILSAIFLKERLSFVGKVGCFSCIIGSVVIAMNAPQQSSVSDIQEMQQYVITPGFLSYAGVIIVGSIITALYAGPRWGKKSMFVYISICSMIGGLSVVATQGLGSAILAQARGESQFKEWFLYVLFAFVIMTLLTEIIFLNKALNIFNAALVTPTYYVFFTSATIVTSAILFQGFKGSGIEIATVIMGFFQICAGVVLLQVSKSAKDVPDAAVFRGDLDQIREIATQQDPESEPKADSIRGAASIIRRISTARQTMAAEEARRFFHEKQQDSLKPPSENEVIEWDGLRRRKTVLGEGPTMSSRPHTPRTPSIKQQHPPWGMSRFPDPEDEEERPDSNSSFIGGIRSRASSVLRPARWRSLNEQDESEMHQIPQNDTEYHGAAGLEPPVYGRERSDTPRSIAWADEKSDDQQHLEPRPTARRQFSFNSVLNRIKPGGAPPSPKRHASPPRGILRRTHLAGGDLRKTATEEERLGLVHGDSRTSGPDEETLNEKLERWSSNESDPGQFQPLFAREGRPHGSSVSTNSTAAFPPYEDHHHHYSSRPSTRQRSPSSEHDAEDEGWHIPTPGYRSRTRTDSNSHAHGRAPPPAQSSFSTHRHPNPLPPLPDVQTGGNEADMSGVTSASDESNMGVTSLPSSPPSDGNHAGSNNSSRPQSGWRRQASEGSSEGESHH
ncbi:hypothetical protein N7510_008722 [Penicillium lagena]|uniref:uncharacterized protein n=1 Tax=Penicillium lagena TaxID=94218 RepID=UPI00254260CA|nr:uncharacterized protein N7510_008722 [Penicillium lagena]KAJ5605941.1 hypothetical protein N7510_008722 [Penicillium lagena]